MDNSKSPLLPNNKKNKRYLDMLKFDREKVFRRYRAMFGKLRQGQVDGIEEVLSFIEFEVNQIPITLPKYGLNYINPETLLADINYQAYLMATIYHETAQTFKPIKEYGLGRGRKYGIPHKTTNKTYYGRGYVQLTWYENYVKMGNEIDLPKLYLYPDLALLPEVSYAISSKGMQNGLFTGKGLKDYKSDDFKSMRRIINGTDKDQLISTYAKRFLRILEL